MDALDRSEELHRRGEKLRARSALIRAAAEETMDNSRRLIAAARKPMRCCAPTARSCPSGPILPAGGGGL